MSNSITLPQLGWQPFFQQQLSLEEWGQVRIARVMAHHRSGFLLGVEQESDSQETSFTLPVNSKMSDVTVGDWLLLDENNRFIRVLDRLSEFSRKAAGSKIQAQMIAANVDTVFIVCSLNDDFNLSRIERYLALTHDAGAEPVVVLTKADCCDEPYEYVQQVQHLEPMLMVEAVNGLDPESVSPLLSWCGVGKTVAFLGSSGVGKSTLVNTLLGSQEQQTGGIREDDSKGRHTTTGRAMHVMPSGGLLLDTPGMRELQLASCEKGIADAFSDITELAEQCRFSNCQHQTEPNCAVQAALEIGTLDARRLKNYEKLKREQARNGASLAEIREKNRSLTKMYRTTQSASRKFKQG